ncbi:FadR/GntR family transcriptional regulator, partial [Vibrio campbellii]
EWTVNDHLFHQTIFMSTGNQFYLPFGNILETIFTQFLAASVEGGRFCLEEHQAIYDAIMAGRSDEARMASHALLNDDNQRLARVVNG